VTLVPTTTTCRWWLTVRGLGGLARPTCQLVSRPAWRSMVVEMQPGMTSHAMLMPASSVKSTS